MQSNVRRLYNNYPERSQRFGELFHASLTVNGSAQLLGLLDSGSMACTINEVTEQRLLSENILTQQELTQRIILISSLSSSSLVTPKCMHEMEMGLYGVKCIVPVLVVAGRKDEIIIGTNMLKYVVHQMKNDDIYWKLISCSAQKSTEIEQFLEMTAGLTRWMYQTRWA